MRANHLKVLGLSMLAGLLTIVTVYASDIDGRIESAAKQSYVFKQYLKADSINVESKEGVVTLTGTVSEESHKSLAQDTVAGLPGVKSVDNKLAVQGKSPAEDTDGWISMQVKSSLLFNRNVDGIGTKVFVKDGVVTLKGEAQSQAQKELTGEYAKDIKGVKDVKNEMTIAKTPAKPGKTMDEKIDDASITAQITLAFLTHHSTSAFNTGIKTDNGVVTLTGTAANSAAKDLATKVAKDIRGVKKVINNMVVEAAQK